MMVFGDYFHFVNIATNKDPFPIMSNFVFYCSLVLCKL